MILFQGKESDPSTLSEVLGQGAGAVSACWTGLSDAGVFESTRAAAIVEDMQGWIEAHYKEVIPGGLATDLGPETFISEDGTVIGHKGSNFYKSCDAYVCDNAEGGQSFCVKRVDHPGNVHEAYNGNTRLE